MAVHFRFKSLYISLPCSAKQERVLPAGSKTRVTFLWSQEQVTVLVIGNEAKQFLLNLKQTSRVVIRARRHFWASSLTCSKVTFTCDPRNVTRVLDPPCFDRRRPSVAVVLA